MIIGIPKETLNEENRVAIMPSDVKQLSSEFLKFKIESGAGNGAFISDENYIQSGAEIVSDVYTNSDMIIRINPPNEKEVSYLNDNTCLVSLLSPFTNHSLIKNLVIKNISSFCLELIPRSTYAQSMDVLSSQATVGGYRAVINAASHMTKFFPMLMTPAGTIKPATVLVLGAGVAGLQAIATASRLGSKVEAFDVRPAAREQVESLGAKFLYMDLDDSAETDSIIENSSNADITLTRAITKSISQARQIFMTDVDSGQNFSADIVLDALPTTESYLILDGTDENSESSSTA